ncbi:MAG: ECF transporter S component [Oscillospiraceae bacterium]|nr:ECF transporter S component [Oscillospiraceae bacterium]
MNRRKNVATFVLLAIAIPFVVIVGALVFKERYYAFVSLCVAFLSCIPLFYAFERRESSSKELAVLAVMIAISVCGRFIFSFLPGFKPVTAITVICAVYLGKEAGFVVGSLSAVVSNFYFGQGPWTPFQMFAWGFLGFIAGLLCSPLKKSRAALCIYGAFAGIAFSLLMDVWATLWADGAFNLQRYAALAVSAIPLTVEYVVSNVIFLLLLSNPIGEKLERIKNKYGLFAV